MYAVGVFAFLRHTLVSSLDQQLDDDVEAAEELLERTGDQVTWRANAHADSDEHADRWIEAWSESGALLLPLQPRRLACD